MPSGKKRIVLSMLEATGPANRSRFELLMFLYSRDNKGYDFVPTEDGPLSFELNHDLLQLVEDGSIVFDNAVMKNNDLKEIPHLRSPRVDDAMELTFPMLLARIRKDHPSYFLDPNRPKGTEGIVTIGYEGRSIDSFVRTLIENGVSVLIDVRNNPVSRKYGFSKGSMPGILSRVGIGFFHFPELGIPSEIRKMDMDDEGWLRMLDDYQASLPEKKQWINMIVSVAEKDRVALMCYEKELDHCHRSRIAKHLMEKGFEIPDI
jgi:hypothetical protein